MVNVHSLALLPLGAWLKIRFGAKLVYDTHELETEVHGLRGLRKKLAKAIERVLIRFVDLTIVVGWEIEKWYRNEYRLDSLVTVLNCPLYQAVQKSCLLRNEFNILDRQKIVLYQGGISNSRGVELLLKAFESIGGDRYVMIFMGYGELEEPIKNAATRCPCIRYKPAVLPSEVLRYTASADIGIVATEDSCLSHHYCLPNKLFEYIMARVPVIVSNLPEIRNIVNTYGIGAVMRDWDAESLFLALDKIEKMNAVDLDRNLHDAAKEFSWNSQEEVMVLAYKTYVVGKVD